LTVMQEVRQADCQIRMRDAALHASPNRSRCRGYARTLRRPEGRTVRRYFTKTQSHADSRSGFIRARAMAALARPLSVCRVSNRPIHPGKILRCLPQLKLALKSFAHAFAFFAPSGSLPSLKRS
jgi:hypothetical protein